METTIVNETNTVITFGQFVLGYAMFIISLLTCFWVFSIKSAGNKNLRNTADLLSFLAISSSILALPVAGVASQELLVQYLSILMALFSIAYCAIFSWLLATETLRMSKKIFNKAKQIKNELKIKTANQDA
jgi:hypothetical protein